ncbi:hypothetical protein JCM1841_000377 [Sporobolomyces salmonicolor]
MLLGVRLYRQLLKEAHRLPDGHASSHYVRQIRAHFRQPAVPESSLQGIRRVKRAEKLLRHLQAANDGYLHALTRVLETSYGLRGPDKHASLQPFLLPAQSAYAFPPALASLVTSPVSHTSRPPSPAQLVTPPTLPERADPTSEEARLLGPVIPQRIAAIKRRWWNSQTGKLKAPLAVKVRQGGSDVKAPSTASAVLKGLQDAGLGEIKLQQGWKRLAELEEKASVPISAQPLPPKRLQTPSDRSSSHPVPVKAARERLDDVDRRVVSPSSKNTKWHRPKQITARLMRRQAAKLLQNAPIVVVHTPDEVQEASIELLVALQLLCAPALLAQTMPVRHFLVGTFNTNLIATLAFDPSAKTLKVVAKNDGQAPHSWLALNEARDRLYATSWTTPPGLASYKIHASPSDPSVPVVSHLNSVQTAARSGYVCVSPIAAYSAGGPTGEVFSLDAETGAFKEDVLQKLDFVGADRQQDDGGVMDFGGLRHGSHSFDLSPDGRLAYVADIGRNAVFVFKVSPEDGSLTLTDKNIAPRPTDGPRHVTPHPNGRYVYSLQEHTSMVDVFEVDQDAGKLKWLQGVKIIPEDHSPTLYWADEVRVSPSQKYLYCSTRGLEPKTRGWVAVFALDSNGLPTSSTPLCLWETPTSGGWANAVQPAPGSYNEDGVEYLALTDSEEGLVMVLSWDGKQVEEVARARLENGAGAATAVWL